MTLPASARPPQALKQPRTIRQLGRTRIDDYAWLKDENWQAVLFGLILLALCFVQ